MIDVIRPELHRAAGVRSQPARLSWGIVDVILAVVMLPFGIWMFCIQAIVDGISSITDR